MTRQISHPHSTSSRVAKCGVFGAISFFATLVFWSSAIGQDCNPPKVIIPGVPCLPEEPVSPEISEFPNCPAVECVENEGTKDEFRYCIYSCFMESFEERNRVVKGGDPVHYIVPTYVTVPKNAVTPLPLLVMLHTGGDDRLFYVESANTTVDDDWNNVTFAKTGYAVLTLTARGYLDSQTGLRASDLNPEAKYWLAFNDPRWDVRDIQHLIGKLVDIGLADPERIGVAGVSYGGMRALMLAMLNDNMEKEHPDQSLTIDPWTSPNGTALSIRAAVPWQPSPSMTYTFLPNGRITDSELNTDTDLNCPFGIPLEEFLDVLFAGAIELAPPGEDDSADFKTWYDRIKEGEPFDDYSVYSKGNCTRSDEIVEQIVDEFDRRSPLYRDPNGSVPVFAVNGLTDWTVYSNQGVQVDRHLRSGDANYPIKSFFCNLHHLFADPVPTHRREAERLADDFLDYYMLGVGKEPDFDIKVATTVCGDPAPEYAASTEFVVSDWDSLSNSVVTLSDSDPQMTNNPSPGDPGFNPFAFEFSGAGNCLTLPVTEDAGTASWILSLQNAFTLIGSPTLTVSFNTDAEDVQLNALLWMLDSLGVQKTLVAVVPYRHIGTPNPTGDPQIITFQLNANAWEFDAGTMFRLEIRSDARPHFQPNTANATTVINSVTLDLPGRCKSSCFEDLTCDGVVDVNDLRLVIQKWGTPDADIDGNGTTDVNDLRAVILAWGLCP